MCGLYFHLNRNKISKKKIDKIKKVTKKYLKFRGPDELNEIQGDNWYAYHSLLSITHNTAKQPVMSKKFVFLYNGEFYNDWKKYSKNYGDVDFFRNNLNKKGISILKKLDGEYALILYDHVKELLYLITDTFGTKPLYYAINKKKEIIATSYIDTLKDMGIKSSKIKKVKANTMIKINIKKNFTLTKIFPLKPFKFNSKIKTTYGDFEKALFESIKKRAHNLNGKKVFLGLSSGHDSGVIALILKKLKISFSAYAVFYGEIKKILDQRINYFNKDKYAALQVLKISKSIRKKVRSFLFKNGPYANISHDDKVHFGNGDYRNNPGFISTGRIIEIAKKRGHKIIMCSLGADEIISDYFNQFTNSRKSCLKGNWLKATKPWKNFYGGWLETFIYGNECLGGTYGIETRYPFLDHKLIQVFLSLPHDLKGKTYKAPITKIFQKYSFPYHEYKIGFYGYKT